MMAKSSSASKKSAKDETPKPKKVAEPKNPPAKPAKAAAKPAADAKSSSASKKAAKDETPKPKKAVEPKNLPVKPAEAAAAKPAADAKPDETAAAKTEEAPQESPPAAPTPKVYTNEEIAEIAKRVETFSDQTPAYNPQYILSPEYQGTSNYEEGIRLVRQETEDRLAALQSDPDASPQQLRQAEEDLKTLDHLYENFHIGMNVFRTAHGGRSKLRK